MNMSTTISTETLRLPNDHPVIGKSFQLTAIDHFHVGLITRFALAYPNISKNKLNLLKLQSTLVETLTEYPELTASVNIGKKVSLIHSNTGVTFTVAKCEMTYEKAVEMNQNEKQTFFATSKSFDLSDNFLCHIKITHIQDDAFVIGISVSHILQDAHSIFQFINAWSYRFNHSKSEGENPFGPFKNCLFTERELLKGHKPDTECMEFKISDVSDEDSFWEGVDEVQQTAVYVSKERLRGLKSNYLEMKRANDPPFISCNDVICGVFFKAIIKARKLDGGQKLKLWFDVNCRERLGLSKNFSGVGAMLTYIFVDSPEVNKLSWWQISVLIRQKLISLDADAIKGKHGFLESSDDWGNCKPIDDFSKHLVFDSWECFPVFESDFGCGKPEKLISCDWLHGVIIILPTFGREETEVLLNLSKEEINIILNDPLIQELIK